MTQHIIMHLHREGNGMGSMPLRPTLGLQGTYSGGKNSPQFHPKDAQVRIFVPNDPRGGQLSTALGGLVHNPWSQQSYTTSH